MSRVAYERVFGQSGYDAVARNKIKKLEEKMGGGSGGGIPMAIIKLDGYDNALMGVAVAVGAVYTYTCTNMTYEEAKAVILSGKPLEGVIMGYYQGDGLITLDTFHFMHVAFRQTTDGQESIIIVTKEVVLEWTPDGLTEMN